ncbi:hypothetical protein NDU88_007472 [Pleurodeles waltl]|uniref:Uncharacterized protein n=1 Tax=Pleurodeles waltl TaxID=8319 RepID=A0AAV7NT70_PLEWA|nr:hypothetical protein NDU88_007472 [Pleurodeles waltl]
MTVVPAAGSAAVVLAAGSVAAVLAAGVEAAHEEEQKLTKEIEDLKKEILENKALANAKEALEHLERTIRDFDMNTQVHKLDKLTKDIGFCDRNLTHAYLAKEYYKQD